MDGFGASITDSSARVLYRLDPAARDAADARPVRPTTATACRSCASRWAPRTSSPAPHYTYDDVPAGQTDYALRHFSIAHDRTQILPLLRQALALNPRAQGDRHAVEPAGVDEDQRLADRRPADRRPARSTHAYARYFVEVRPGLRARGRADLRASRVQNEPQNRNPSGYPGMDMPVAQEAKLIDALGPPLRARRPATRRSSATTTTGPSTPNDIAHDAARRGPRDRVPDRPAREPRRRAGSPAPRSTATPATRAARPRCTTRSRTRASGSPSAPARTARPTRRRRSSPTR